MPMTYLPQADFYQLLGVAPIASDADIKRAFKAQALLFHDDRGGDGERMRALNHAKKVLLDPQSRAEYDNARRAYHEAIQRQLAAAFNPPPMPPVLVPQWKPARTTKGTARAAPKTFIEIFDRPATAALERDEIGKAVGWMSVGAGLDVLAAALKEWARKRDRQRAAKPAARSTPVRRKRR